MYMLHTFVMHSTYYSIIVLINWFYSCMYSLTYARTYYIARTFHSNMTTAVPDAAPDPAIPTKLTLPMLLANNDMPI